jgi:aminopeptidase N
VLPFSSLLLSAYAAEPIAPSAPGAYGPDRPWDVVKLHLDLDVDPATHRVAGAATYSLAPVSSGPFVVQAVGLDVTRVELVGASTEPLTWRVDGEDLRVDVPTGAPATVRFTYSATPRTGLHFRAPGKASPDRYGEVWSQGEGIDHRHWFPLVDHPGDRFAYEGDIRGPKGWKVLTNSGPDVVSYLVMLAMAPYDVHGDATNQVWVGPGVPAEAVRPIFEPVPAMMAHLEQRTGAPYPWGVYHQVIVQRFLYGGMENTGATINSDRILVGPATRAARPGVESLVAHELAHQWFGDLLTCRDWHDLWLNEGFATYFAADWMAARTGTRDEAEWAASVRGWHDAAAGRGSLTGAWYLGPTTPKNHAVYVKGASVLEMLRHEVGDDAFWRAIRRYVATHAHGLVETEDLARAFEAESGRVLDGFFHQWTELPYVPALSSSWAYADGDLTVRLRQDVASNPAYALRVAIAIGADDGTWTTKTVRIDDDALDVVVPAGAAPAWVAVNHDGGLLAAITQQQSVASWAAQLRAAPPYARIDAARALGKRTGAEADDAAAALTTTLDDGAAPEAIRRAAADALGTLLEAEPLLAVIGDPTQPPGVRLAAANATPKAARATHVPTLVALRGKEPTADVRAALHRAIGNADPARAVTIARQVLRSAPARPGYDDGTYDVEYGAAADALGAWGEPSDLALLLTQPVSHDRLHASMYAAVRVTGRIDPGAARTAARVRVARAAEALLVDADLRARRLGVEILGEVGDEASLVALDALRRIETVSALAERAAAVSTTIRGRRDPVHEPPNELDARLKAMEERLRALEERDQLWMD